MKNSDTTSQVDDASAADTVDAHDVVITQPSRKRPATTSAVGFVAEHPLLVVAGGIAAGLVLGALIPRRSKKAIVHRTSALGDLIGAAALSFGKQAAARADAAGTQVRKGSHVLADRAEDWTALALRGASAFAQSAAENMTKLGETAAEKAEQFGDAAAEQIGHGRKQAAKRVDKAIPAVQATAEHAGKRVSDALAELRARIKG